MANRSSVKYLLVTTLLIIRNSMFAPCLAQETDADGDGLSDFHERHKYLTNPQRVDSDGDGKPDSDWLERRETRSTVRSVVQVMKPVTVEYLTDDYQDARMLDETANYVELEVIHYPFNTVASTLSTDDNWRQTIAKSKELQHWLEAGPTADWTPELRKQITEAASADGIEVANLSDRELVEKLSHWLLQHAEYEDGFSTFITAFDNQGRPYIPDDLKDALDRTKDITVEQQWEQEISASGMFRTGKRGSCTSSAIYLNGCLRAAGLPTRILLCIPIVDASDENEMRMVARLRQPSVRRVLLGALEPLKGSWASHTFNEVYVGGRWHRLNYQRLGQNIYDNGLFGLMTHVATFHDWADARMPETIGRRQRNHPDDVLGGPNPYSTISLRDQTGVHCKLDLPQSTEQQLTLERLHWTDSDELPKEIVANCRERGRFGLIAEVTGVADHDALRTFLEQADLRVYLFAQDNREAPRLGVGFDKGCYWLSNGRLRIYVPFGQGDIRDLVEGVRYTFRPRNNSEGYIWRMNEELVISRNSNPER